MWTADLMILTPIFRKPTIAMNVTIFFSLLYSKNPHQKYRYAKVNHPVYVSTMTCDLIKSTNHDSRVKIPKMCFVSIRNLTVEIILIVLTFIENGNILQIINENCIAFWWNIQKSVSHVFPRKSVSVWWKND